MMYKIVLVIVEPLNDYKIHKRALYLLILGHYQSSILKSRKDINTFHLLNLEYTIRTFYLSLLNLKLNFLRYIFSVQKLE